MKSREQSKAHREKRFRTLKERKAASKYGNYLADRVRENREQQMKKTREPG